MKSPAALTVFLLLASTASSAAFTSPVARSPALTTTQQLSTSRFMTQLASEKSKEEEAVFVPTDADDEDEDESADIPLDTVEKLGKGAAKVKRGKRKGGKSGAPTAKKTQASLAPEETFYEGPPAITETIAPTVSILTVVGIIPAAAAWARQAWVRYKITSRRIRVTSGVGGKDMAEIVYPDIVEIRTVKRLFGDGDMVAFLRDGAKFEMRNIPDFDEAIEFMLKYMDKDVVEQYRDKGDVTRPE